jgi:hypothetical protein
VDMILCAGHRCMVVARLRHKSVMIDDDVDVDMMCCDVALRIYVLPPLRLYYFILACFK